MFFNKYTFICIYTFIEKHQFRYVLHDYKIYKKALPCCLWVQIYRVHDDCNGWNCKKRTIIFVRQCDPSIIQAIINQYSKNQLVANKSFDFVSSKVLVI